MDFSWFIKLQICISVFKPGLRLNHVDVRIDQAKMMVAKKWTHLRVIILYYRMTKSMTWVGL